MPAWPGAIDVKVESDETDRCRIFAFLDDFFSFFSPLATWSTKSYKILPFFPAAPM
jgi:hypothetical protein